MFRVLASSKGSATGWGVLRFRVQGFRMYGLCTITCTSTSCIRSPTSTYLPNSQWETLVSAAGKSSTSLRFHSESLDVACYGWCYKSSITWMTLHCRPYGIFLILGNAEFMSSTKLHWIFKKLAEAAPRQSTDTGLVRNQGEKSISFYFILVPSLRKSIKVWYSKAHLHNARKTMELTWGFLKRKAYTRISGALTIRI